MKILLFSPFAPKVGGMETIALILSKEWISMGHTVTVVTETAQAETGEEFPFEVVRRPDFKTLRRLIKNHDLYLQSNISLNYLLAWLGTRKPLFISHHTALYSRSRKDAMLLAVKRFIISRATNICVSRAIAEANAPHSHIIGNAYDDANFRLRPEIERNKELVFVGRLVPTKGVDVLLRALKILQTRGLTPHLTIIGTGPRERMWRDLCAELGLDRQVEWAGVLRGEALATRIAAHRILVAPSTWQEPFGIVALEGMACGCMVVGSRGGGLSDAIGPGGATFQNGDSQDLARVLAPFLQNPATTAPYIEAAPDHLEKHKPQNIARAYLQLFES